MDASPQIALLIDADNATASRIDVILGELSALGETNIRRAYGNWTKSGLKSWQEVLHDNAIRPVQEFDKTKNKNASDIALAVDAVDILHTQHPDAFAIVSSDADFTPLVMRLREYGARVYGFGDAKTPEPFQSACTRFLVLNRLDAPSGVADTADVTPDDAPRAGTADAEGPAAVPPSGGAARTSAARKTAAKRTAAQSAATKQGAPTAPPGRATRTQLRADNRLVALLRRAVSSAADESGWARIGPVAQRISNQSSFDSRNYGYAKLSKLLEASELFDIRGSGTPDMALRDRRGDGSSSGA
ncbi:MAG: NYN domain-containing protein [Dermatophilaceae bacterium]